MYRYVLGVKPSFLLFWLLVAAPSFAAKPDGKQKAIDPFWNNAIVYFMLTDRFANGDTSNDKNFNERYLNKSISAVYTDFWDINNSKCYLINVKPKLCDK